jgi:hypothetical protein
MKLRPARSKWLKSLGVLMPADLYQLHEKPMQQHRH